MSDLIKRADDADLEVMPSFDFVFEKETEQQTQIAEHRAWLKSIKHERPLPKHHFKVAVYQVVRREFFAHTNEPSITFNNFKVYVNAACLSRFPSVDYVQVLVNSDSKILAIRPCREEERDAFSWCVPGSARRKPRQITCRLFFVKVFSLMDWNTDYRYKLLGKVIHANDEYLIAFDLSATEVYQRVFKDGEKPKTSRTPVFPEGWQNQFGLPFKEHRNSMQVNIFEGYAVYGIKENSVTTTVETEGATSDAHPVEAANNNALGGSDV